MPFDSQDFNPDKLDIIDSDSFVSTSNYYNSPDNNTFSWRVKTELADGSDHWENCDMPEASRSAYRDLLNDRCLTLYDNGVNFDLYQFSETTDNWEFVEAPSPYTLIEDLDELSNPLPHGQLLPHLTGDVDEDLIYLKREKAHILPRQLPV